MAARPDNPADRGVPGVRRIARPRFRAVEAKLTTDPGGHETGLRYRLDVASPSVADVVRFAGGWLFDRVMAGWDVTVRVGDPAAARPLRVLGAHVLDLELPTAAGRPVPQSLAVAGALFGADARVRGEVLGALSRGATEVTLWGQAEAAELDGAVDAVHHRLSHAARAFKAQALAAAGAMEQVHQVGPVETFRSARTLRRLVAADLIPAS